LIHNVYILKVDGTCLIQRKYGSLEVDESLISGFITAINTFAEQIIQRQVDEIVMGDLKFIYSRSTNLDVIYAVCADSETNSDEIKDIFDQVDDKFVKTFREEIIGEDSLKDNSIFQEFIPSLDMLVQKMIVDKESRDIGKSVVNTFKKLIKLTSLTNSSPSDASTEKLQDSSIEITHPEEGLKELNNIYTLNTDALKTVKSIPTQDMQYKLALQYINGKNTVEDIILSLQLLGYKTKSAEDLIAFFKECETKGYLKLVS
jgi:hypothetical protein